MLVLLDKFFPFWRIRNIALFYILSMVYNFWFVSGVWVFIWGRFMTNTQIGISDAITFTVGFVVEVPSGVIADLVGRKKAILAGNILMTAGSFLLALSSSFLGITWWYLVWTVGYAFQSGATEALAYDSLRREGLEKEWEHVIATSTMIGRTAALVTTAAGGMLFTIWFRLPYMVLGVAGLLGVIAALLLNEIQVRKSEELPSFSLYFRQVRDGFATLSRKTVLPVALLCLSLLGTSYMYDWGLLRPLTGERFGFTPQTYAYLLSMMSLATILALGFLPKIRKRFSLEKLLYIIGGLFAVAFFFMGFSHIWLIGGLIMIALSILSTFTEVLFSQFINLHTREEHRATTLSAVALFTRLPYVFLALLIGRLADADLLPQYTLIVGGLGILIWGGSLLLYRTYQQHHQHA